MTKYCLVSSGDKIHREPKFVQLRKMPINMTGYRRFDDQYYYPYPDIYNKLSD